MFKPRKRRYRLVDIVLSSQKVSTQSGKILSACRKRAEALSYER
jgi:hypothetical protein